MIDSGLIVRAVGAYLQDGPNSSQLGMKREGEWGAEGEGENEGGETARARRNGGQTASARSQASTRPAAARCSSGDREISCADRCSEKPGFKATAPRAKGEGEIM
jgi:hypothetical protein